MMPGMNDYFSQGNKIMIGHSALPEGNHYEMIEKISQATVDSPVFMPLAYGDNKYKVIIKEFAKEKFSNIEFLENKLDPISYYRKLTEVGWAVFNANVQQALGNIIALVWMGAKIFFKKNVSTYRDFSEWGLIVFNIEDHLNKTELSSKLSSKEIENNRKIIFERFNENKVTAYWEKILN
jgi:hypothetical protein